jgi:hypothetical protein
MPVAIRKLTQYGLKILREAPNETGAIEQLKEAHRVYLASPQSCRHPVYHDGGITVFEQCTGTTAAKLWRKPPQGFWRLRRPVRRGGGLQGVRQLEDR